MNRIIFAAALAAMLAGCMSSESPTAPAAEPIPSGNQAPRVMLTIVSGTKAAPVDTPVVMVTWWHQNSLNGMRFDVARTIFGIRGGYGEQITQSGERVIWDGINPIDSFPIPPFKTPSDSYTFKAPGCIDSLWIHVAVFVGSGNTWKDTAVYCK